MYIHNKYVYKKAYYQSHQIHMYKCVSSRYIRIYYITCTFIDVYLMSLLDFLRHQFKIKIYTSIIINKYIYEIDILS